MDVSSPHGFKIGDSPITCNMTPAKRHLGLRRVDIVAKKAAKVVADFHFGNRGEGTGFDADIVRIVCTISMWHSNDWRSFDAYRA